jgi:hypothetical protein
MLGSPTGVISSAKMAAIASARPLSGLVLQIWSGRTAILSRVLQYSSALVIQYSVSICTVESVLRMYKDPSQLLAIAGSTGLFQVLKVNDFESRFEIASTRARELRALDSRWDSWSDLDH